MRKQLFYMLMFFGSVFTVSAQNTCTTAVAVTTGSTTVGTIDGTYQAGCWATAADGAEWYSYTAIANGMYRINTNLPINDGVTYSDDSRISVFTGTCAALICYAAADDIDDENYLTDFSFAVAAGQTYYIAFDDRWSDMTIVFESSFTSMTCFPVTGGFEFVGDPTPEEVTITWDEPVVGTFEGYQLEYGEEGFTQGEGEVVNVTTNEVTFADLTGGTTYAFYIRTFCGDTDYSTWTGPITFTPPYGPSDLPYEFGFEPDALNGGWTGLLVNEEGGGWDIYIGSEAAPAYEGDQFAAASGAAAASDAWFFSRGINLEADDEVHISYYIAKAVLEGDGNENNLEVTIGTDTTVEGQTNTLATFDDYSITEYTQKMHTFTAPSSGVYYLGYHYTAPAHNEDNFGGILLDAVSVSSELGIIDLTDSGFAIYPNPTSDLLTISNMGAQINSVEIVDLNGRIVKTVDYPGTSELQVNISDLSAGMYLINISSDKGLTTSKIIKK